MSIAPAKRPRGEILNVQSLRAVAAILVVLKHMASPQVGVDGLFKSSRGFLSPFADFGQFGVDLFFVISGFIMVATTFRFMGSTRAGAIFLMRRVVRIYPPYWFALLPVLMAHWYLSRRGIHMLGGAQTAATSFTGTFFLLPHPANEFLLLPPAWTLVFEMSFYIVFAIVLVLKPRFLPAALGAWLIAEVVMYYAFRSSGNFLLAFLGTPLPIEFISGAFIGVLYVRGSLPLSKLAAILALIAIAVFWTAEVALGTVAYAHFDSSQSQAGSFYDYHNNLGRAILAGIPAFLIVYSAVSFETRGRVLAPSWLVKIGDASYSLYLWNLTIIVAARQVIHRARLDGDVAHVLMNVVTFALVLTVSMLVYKFFERPVTNRLHRLLALRTGVASHEAHAPTSA